MVLPYLESKVLPIFFSNFVVNVNLLKHFRSEFEKYDKTLLLFFRKYLKLHHQILSKSFINRKY